MTSEDMKVLKQTVLDLQRNLTLISVKLRSFYDLQLAYLFLDIIKLLLVN